MPSEVAKAAVAALRSAKTPACRELLKDGECSPIAMFVAAHKVLGPGWTAWLPETVEHEVIREGGTEALSDELGACLGIAETGAPWRDWQAFAATCHAFAHVPVATHGFIPPEPHQMAATVIEMTIIYGLATLTDDYSPELSEDVEAYVAAALAEHGMCCTPPELSFAQHRLDRLVTHVCGSQKAAKDGGVTESEDPATPAVIQSHRLEEIREYVKARLSQALTQIKSLT